MDHITSPRNDRVKQVRLLQRQSKTRRKTRRLVLEGVRLVTDALESGVQPDYVLVAEDALAALPAGLLARLESAGVGVSSVTAPLMADMADTESPQGVVGVFPWPDLPAPPSPTLALVIDGWRDPGNLGTVIRTAAAAGVDLVVLTPGTVDPTNPKVLRAAMGAHFRVPIQVVGWAALAERLRGLRPFRAALAGSTPYTRVNWAAPSAIIVGGEAHGFSDAIQALDAAPVTIPMQPNAESLNAAVAASILIYAARAHTWA